MSNFLYKSPEEVKKAASQAATKSLLGKIKNLQSRMKNNLLIDISGSMAEEDGEGNSKHSVMQGIVDKLPREIRKFAFNSSVQEIDRDIPFPSGGTSMHLGFDFVKSKGVNEIVLITDGHPDSQEKALRAAQGLIINIIYIGPQPKPQFLEDLAGRTKGSFVDVNMLEEGAANLLEEKVMLFLNP